MHFFAPICADFFAVDTVIKMDQNVRMESSELDFLCNLVSQFRPKKILQTSMATREIDEALQNCICGLDYVCQMYSVHDLTAQPFPTCLETVGPGIDLLILDAVGRTPMEVMDFLVAFPYLQRDAIVAVRDVARWKRDSSHKLANSMLMKNITARRFPHCAELYPDFKEYVTLCIDGTCSVDYNQELVVITAVQIFEETEEYLNDLFAVLYSPWTYRPDANYLRTCDIMVGRHCSLEQMLMYKEAVIKEYSVGHPNEFRMQQFAVSLHLANQYIQWLTSMNQSILGAFPHVLLYGKGRRGQMFLYLAKKIGINVGGFVVSDGYTTIPSFKELPVYEFSKIPYDQAQTLVIQTAELTEIEQRLQTSGCPWLKLPDHFWITCVRVGFLDNALNRGGVK